MCICSCCVYSYSKVALQVFTFLEQARELESLVVVEPKFGLLATHLQQQLCFLAHDDSLIMHKENFTLCNVKWCNDTIML